MTDALLLIIVAAAPAVVGIVVLAWGVLDLLTGYPPGQSEREARALLHPAPRLEARGTPIDPPRRGTA